MDLLNFTGGLIVALSLFCPTMWGQTIVSNTKLIGKTPSIEAFADTVFPIVRENCSQCHGKRRSPLFAVKDRAKGHDTLLKTNKINFNNPAKSRLVERLKNDQHNCWSKNCAEDAQIMLAAIEEWKKQLGENFDKNVEFGLIVTKDLQFKDGKMSLDKKTSILSFDLSPLTKGVGEIYLFIDVIDFDKNSYVIKNPRLSVRNVIIGLKGLSFMVNNEYDPNNATFMQVSKSFSYPGANISEAAMVVLKDRGTSLDRFALSFNQLEINPTQVKDPPLELEKLEPASLIPIITEAKPILEAETGELSGTFVILKENDREFIASPENGLLRNADDDKGGKLIFKVYIEKSGDYQILGLVKPDDYSRNSFYLSVDQSPFLPWGMEPLANDWKWSAANGKNGGAPLVFTLQAGEHLIQIKEREDATPLDKLMIIKNDPAAIEEAILNF